MTKRKLKLRVRLPPYPGRSLGSPNARSKRIEWRQDIKKAARRSLGDEAPPYADNDKLELDIRFYFGAERAVGLHDVDNRLKDIMDALQGALGGTKGQRRRRRRLITNDRQIHKVTIEKLVAPGQSGGRGHLTIRKYKPRFVTRATAIKD